MIKFADSLGCYDKQQNELQPLPVTASYTNSYNSWYNWFNANNFREEYLGNNGCYCRASRDSAPESPFAIRRQFINIYPELGRFKEDTIYPL